MLADRPSRAERRGIVLVLVLAILGLLALIGVTFATYSGQARINNRNYQQSLLQPQADELLDFALGQLINDTTDGRSAIRGHSLARDMYGTGSLGNGYLPIDPSTGGPFYITGITATGTANLYQLTTNIVSNDPTFYGFNFTRWIMRVAYAGTPTGTGTVNQTFEIIFDSGFNPSSNQARSFQVVISNPDAGGTTVLNGEPTALVNPTPAPGFPSGFVTQLPGQYLVASLGNTTLGTVFPFILDGRWLNAFNGPGIGATSSSVTGFSNAVYGNFRFNGLLNPGFTPPFGPNTVGMDEDYDACDLENWYLALQSADGQVMIPSFHRPAAIRNDPANFTQDWIRTNQSGPNGTSLWADSAARILRPCQADGHDAATFPDLIPSNATGQITYDVDNDGDGQTDSVWLDLGYPARPDASGRLYKPLFAFMVIGLNGKIPLNTAGNLAGVVPGVPNPAGVGGGTPPVVNGGVGHSLHLGNSTSEIDPTYALQNGFNPTTGDPLAAFTLPPNGVAVGAGTTIASNTQVDTAAVDVRLTQLRNLLAGTRPQNHILSPDSTTNGDTNYVWANNQTPLYMPNGIADGNDAYLTDASGNPYVVRTTQPVPGRWGEAQSVPGTPLPNPNYVAGSTAGTPASYQFVDVVTLNYASPIRAGYSMDIGDIWNGLPRDAADDNFNMFDPYPGYPNPHNGEINDADLYDPAGALLLPVERMRRWLTPADINGTGSVTTWSQRAGMVNHGADPFGRVELSSYFRPPGAPGVISTNYTVPVAGGIPTPPAGEPAFGVISFPNSSLPSPDPFYTSGPANTPPMIAPVAPAPALAYPAYLPDLTNNPLHGYESFRVPNQNYMPPTFMPNQLGGAPTDENFDLTTGAPTMYPTYDSNVAGHAFAGNITNGYSNSDGLNEADEMNLYQPNPLLDSPFGPSDLEWLYRQQDVDGAYLSSRLAQLAPISFTNAVDGARRRKLFSLDFWDTNNFVWTTDNPANAFPSNSRFAPTASAGFQVLNNLPTPTLAQRNKKINLNYPLPVSNDPNEPIRQKWINDTYQLLKVILPPLAVDTPEELAQLSQFVINIVDYRDPDCTMTHWVNPDVVIAGVLSTTATSGTTTVPTTAITLQPFGYVPPITTPPTQTLQLDQFGMEYNPVALNEVLAFSYQYIQSSMATPTRANRFFVELVNTLTSPELMTASAFNPVLPLGGFQYTAGDPYSCGSWDLVFTKDEPYSRPDPYSGQLVPYANMYGLTPLNQDSFNPPAGGGLAQPVTLTPLSSGPNIGTAPPAITVPGSSIPLPLPVGTVLPGGSASTVPIDYFYAFGNLPPSVSPAGGGSSTSYETGSPGPTQYYTPTTIGTGFQSNGSTYVIPNSTTPSLVQTLTTTIDPINGTNVTPPTASPIPIYQGTLPPISVSVTPGTNNNPNSSTTTLPVNYLPSIPLAFGTTPKQLPLYYWVCLRRPANPFAPVSATNPMVVVDAVRFPYMDASSTTNDMAKSPDTTPVPNGTPASPAPGTKSTVFYPFSVQRFQPYRGGHAVAVPQLTITTPAPLDPRYGYSEQMVVPSPPPPTPGAPPLAPAGSQLLQTAGIYYIDAQKNQYYDTPYIYHTLGWANEFEQGSQNLLAEPWDYLPFLDRDYTSVAELLLVPACSPGLFTKQFVEFAPSYNNITTIFSQVLPTENGPSGVANTTVNGPPTAGPSTNASATGGTTSTSSILSYNTASTPLAFPATPAFYASGNGSGLTTTSPTFPVQPHTYPYLTDKFFYSGYGGANTLDSGGLVGGYGADGWFKMFEFLEVPSQMIGAIGPVAQGTNFDWLRQDFKPGQLNLNLIIDEEVFFSVVGRQTVTQSRGQFVNSQGNAQFASDQFTQQLLNFDQIVAGGPTAALLMPPGNYTPLGSNPNVAGNTAPPWLIPLPPGSPPIPMVVTSTLANGAPASAYPIWNPSAVYGGLLAADPIYNNYFLGSSTNASGATPIPPQYTNALKASWIQFLWLRHGGSGYMFGYGSGAVGQNVSVATPAGSTLPGANGQTGNAGIPADIPFRSLSFPDIDHTVMRPAALPPTPFTTPAPYPPTGAAALTAGQLYGNAATGQSPWQNPSTYGTVVPPSNLTDTTGLWNLFSGDPGVRNYLLYAGYPSAALAGNPGALPAGWTAVPQTTYLGYPGAANPSPPGGLPTTATSWPVYPPPIPARRLFQIPDAYNPNAGALPIATAPLSASNASETGDPSLNLVTVIPNPPAADTAPVPAPGALPPISYNNGIAAGVLTNSVVNLYWPGGSAATMYTGTAGATAVMPVNLPNGVSATHYLGASSGATATDMRQHPYWRSEHLQRIINQTTVRTHQYAVWITVGFFQIKRQGDLGMYASNPALAFDILGPEIGAANGKTTRFRGFFLVDRLQLTGFNPNSPSGWRPAVVYRSRIQ